MSWGSNLILFKVLSDDSSSFPLPLYPIKILILKSQHMVSIYLMVCPCLFHYLIIHFGVKNNAVKDIMLQQQNCGLEAPIHTSLAERDKRVSVTVFRHSNPDPGYDKKEQDLQIKNPYENKIPSWYEGYESSNII